MVSAMEVLVMLVVLIEHAGSIERRTSSGDAHHLQQNRQNYCVARDSGKCYAVMRDILVGRSPKLTMAHRQIPTKVDGAIAHLLRVYLGNNC